MPSEKSKLQKLLSRNTCLLARNCRQCILNEMPLVNEFNSQFLSALVPNPVPSLSSISTCDLDGRTLSRNRGFDIEILEYNLRKCVRPTDGEIDIDGYLTVYMEICKLLDNLSPVIRRYIGGDIKQKLGIMKRHRASANGTFYETIEKMVPFEKSKEIEKKNEENGSRTILRLHRSLYFVAEFLRNLNKLSQSDGVGESGRNAYNRTLASQHPWVYKQIARLALSTLGEKRSLMANFHDGSMTPLKLEKVIDSVVTIATRICNQCQAIYETYDFLELP